ncbi:MAG: DNA cytosine methyltransferase [Acidimicrobiia bacterium]
MTIPRLPAISLFSNCGAGDSGYARAGFRFQVLAELQQPRLNVAALNHRQARTVPGDLRDTWPEVVAAYRERLGGRAPALLAACPPCQGLSSAQSRRGLAEDADAGSRDHRNLLIEVVAEVALALLPRAIVVENVVAFLTRSVRHPDTGQAISAARLLVERLAEEYRAFAIRTDLADFGVPQARRRAFVTLVRRDEPGLARFVEAGCVPFPRPTHGNDTSKEQLTLRTALAALAADPLDAAEDESAGTGMHRVPVWNERRYRMVARIPPNSGLSAWDNTDCDRCGAVSARRDYATCERCGAPLLRPVIKDKGRWRLISGFRNSSYRRMAPDRPAPAITTASGRIGSDNTLHPSENRVLSMLECQYLQTIPETFDWGDHLDTHGHTSLRAMIGEAVPPQFTQMHGAVLASLLDGRLPRHALSANDQRVQEAHRRLQLGQGRRLTGQSSLSPPDSATGMLLGRTSGDMRMPAAQNDACERRVQSSWEATLGC